MTIRIKALPSNKRVIVAMERAQHTHRQGVKDGFHIIGQLVGIRTKKLIINPPKTGRVYRIKGIPHQASAPGEAPANRTGRLARSYNYQVSGDVQLAVGESAPYAGYLEDGTRKMKKRPHLIRAINETQGQSVAAMQGAIDRAVKKANR